LWASSIEAAAPPKVLFLFPSNGEALKPELYQRQLPLGALSSEAIGALIRSLLGRASLPSEFVARVARESNGSPELAIAIIQESIENRIIARRGGAWSLTHTASIEGMRFASASSHYLSMYQAMPSAARSISIMLALLPGKVGQLHLERAMPNVSVAAAIANLSARGWITSRGSHLRLASDSIGEAILGGAEEEALRLAARSLVGAGIGGLTEADLADLSLRSNPSEAHLMASIAVANRLIDRGDVSQAVSRLKRAVALAQSMGLSDAEANALLVLADAEHRLGHHESALALLKARDGLACAATRVGSYDGRRLEASIVAALGDYDRARECLMALIEEATARGGIRTALDSHAQLAELDWSRGNEVQRSAAIERIRQVLDQVVTEQDVGEQRAALTYGLGSALIRAGRRDEALRVLEDEYANAPTDYWRMRIANALSSANYYLTNLDAGLDWADRALEHAERASADALRVRVLSNRAIMLFGLGRIREAADEHMRTAALARRVGNQFEYASACVSTGADLVWLARYEEAIRYAEEAATTASMMNDLRYRGKSLEVKAWALFLSGDLDEARGVAEQARQVMEEFEYIDCRPRIDWLRARIHAAKREFREAEKVLVEVERGLLVTRDLEDLWGVQIELNRIRQKVEPAVKHLDTIGEIATESNRTGVVVVYLAAAIALAEGFIEGANLPEHLFGILAEALKRSERAGTDEMTWQLQMSLGRVVGDSGDQHAAKGYFTSALRTIRLIADRLSPGMRHHYLTSPAVKSGLRAMT
jgi:tetratricopeptide (TPR) repeat protein